MVLRIAFHNVFSRLPGGLQHFAGSSGILQNQPTIFNPSLIETMQQTFPPLFLRNALSAIAFVSDRRGEHVRLIHDKSSKDLPNSSELSV